MSQAKAQSMLNAKTIKRILGLILYSKIFFMVSCSVGSYQFGKVISYQQANRDEPQFVQVLLYDSDGNYDYLTSRSEIKSAIENVSNGAFSFLLPEEGGVVSEEDFSILSYTVKPLGENQQEITVVNRDDDYTRTSIYTATPDKVTSTYSHIFGVGHMMGGSLYAFCVALGLYFIGWLIMRKEIASKKVEADVG